MDAFQRRDTVRELYGDLFNQASAVLFEFDPMSISFVPNEYDPEVGTILPRLRECRSADDVQRVVYEEFVQWFNLPPTEPLEKYAGPATQIWQMWQQFQGRTRPA